MKVFVNNEPIPLTEIDLDDLGWDNSSIYGNILLSIHLDDADLEDIGQQLLSYAEQCVADEADFFDDEYMEDVPVPTSNQEFVEKPELLTTYLRNNFWRREAVLAVIAVSRMYRVREEVRYWIKDFKQLRVVDGHVIAEFGV